MRSYELRLRQTGRPIAGPVSGLPCIPNNHA